MIMQRPVPVLAAALLLAAGSVWAARGQDARSPADDSSAGERVEVPRAEPQESPSQPPPEPPSEPPSESPSEPIEPADHTAVPRGPDDAGHGPNRQPPTHHGGGGNDDDDGGGGGGVADDESYAGSGYEDDDFPSDVSGYSPLFPFLGGGRSPRADMGALDLDISPGRTRVYLDGQPIGTADDFDGWPKYLWLPEGTYDLVFYLDGYQTIGRRMRVHRALVIDMDDRLQPGRSTRPEDFQPERR